MTEEPRAPHRHGDGPPRPTVDACAIRPMRSRHLRGVLDIERRVYPRPWPVSLFASELAQRADRCYLVALGTAQRWWDPHPVLGFGGVLRQADDAHITTLAVDPAHHRRKIGSRLLLALLRTAVGWGVQAATLEVRARNIGAQRLYGAFGFVPAGVRPGYYGETGEDALVMWVHDLQSADFARRLQQQRARLSAPGGTSGSVDFEVPWVRGRVGLDGGPGQPLAVPAPGTGDAGERRAR